MKVTGPDGDNPITDKQIRELYKDLQRDLRRMTKLAGSAANLETEALRSDIAKCSIALTDRRAMAMLLPGVAQGIERARSRCAEIWNALHGGEP